MNGMFSNKIIKLNNQTVTLSVYIISVKFISSVFWINNNSFVLYTLNLFNYINTHKNTQQEQTVGHRANEQNASILRRFPYPASER